MNFGSTLDSESHWELLDAAVYFGRGFVQNPTRNKTDTFAEEMTSDTSASVLLKRLLEGKTTSYYNQTSASSKQGIALRMMMVFFGERSNSESSTLQAIKTLQSLDESRVQNFQDDKSFHAKFVDFLVDSSLSQAVLPGDIVPERNTKLASSSPLSLNPKVRSYFLEFTSFSLT